jgi:hypothetical protein
VYTPYVMLRNLGPREMTAREQREADEQLGRNVAALAGWGHRVAARVHRVAALAARNGHRRAAFRKAPGRAPCAP